jgi:putative ABC transport system substrate-binding protein
VSKATAGTPANAAVGNDFPYATKNHTPLLSCTARKVRRAKQFQDTYSSPHKWRSQNKAAWQPFSEGAVGRMRHVDVMRLGAVFLALVVFALPLAAEAQPATRIPRLCFLTFDPGTPQSSRFDPFFQGLRDLGYVDGQTISIDYLSAGGRGEQFPALAADCLRLKADIVVVTTTPAAQAAKNATSTIPIVMHSLGDPVATGLIASLARPGGNVTGTTLMASGLAAKRLGLLKEIVPRISRVLVLSYLVDPIAAPQLKELESAAHSLGVSLLVRDIRTADDLPAAFAAGAREGAEGVLTTAESIFVVQRNRVVQLAAQHRLPGMYPYRSMVDAGGLMAYDSYTSDLHRRAATYVDRILKGAKPADLPVEQPTTFELVINLKAARSIGLTIPRSVLLRADEVIQ